MVAKTYSMGLYGMEAFPVEVEADLSKGLPAFELVGLPDAAVKESRDRVRAALKNCGFEFPVSRITMNLAPADKKKEGPIYDLPLLISLLKASHQLECHTDDAVFLGELSLSGELRPIRGVLPWLRLVTTWLVTLVPAYTEASLTFSVPVTWLLEEIPVGFTPLSRARQNP